MRGDGSSGVGSCAIWQQRGRGSVITRQPESRISRSPDCAWTSLSVERAMQFTTVVTVGKQDSMGPGRGVPWDFQPLVDTLRSADFSSSTGLLRRDRSAVAESTSPKVLPRCPEKPFLFSHLYRRLGLSLLTPANVLVRPSGVDASAR